MKMEDQERENDGSEKAEPQPFKILLSVHNNLVYNFYLETIPPLVIIMVTS